MTIQFHFHPNGFILLFIRGRRLDFAMDIGNKASLGNAPAHLPDLGLDFFKYLPVIDFELVIFDDHVWNYITACTE